MKRTFLIVLLLLIYHAANSQFIFQGIIRDKSSGEPLPKATVVMDQAQNSEADGDGLFILKNVTSGMHHVEVRHIGYQTLKMDVSITENTQRIIDMELKVYMEDPIEITATRANSKTGMAFTDLSKADIEKSNTGRDIPYLLESVPSLVATSDAGNGIGYTGVRIRGSDGTRINVTLDGIPVNDAESQILYWVDLPDLASSVDNIQVQRGVGTSTNGASAFGGSINIQSNKPYEKPYVTTSATAGSFNTFKSTISLGTGMVNDKWNFEGRLSKIVSDGYVDRATSDLKSFYVGGGYYAKKDVVKFKIYSGKEITYQSWYGVPEAALDTNRTWNYYTYENQVDNYQQDNYQLFYTHHFTDFFQVNTAVHYTRGNGYYEEYKEDEALSDYNLNTIIIGSDTITNTNLVRRKWLSNDFYGATLSAKYDPSENTSIIFGGAWNQYDGDHYGEVIWAQYASNGFINDKYYDDNGLKTDFNFYGKITTRIISRLNGFLDLQYRNVNYDFTIYDSFGEALKESDELHFFNPKVGLTWAFNPSQYAYVSFSVGNKEPSRDDYTESSLASRPLPERLYDLEAGYQLKKEKFTAGINFYLMQYDNQLVLTGELNDVGNYTRTNIDNSFREGIELEGQWNLFKKFSLAGNITFSKNKIKEFREFTDDYDNGGQVMQIYNNTNIAFSPEMTGFLTLGWKPFSKFEMQLVNRFTGQQYLDNTSKSTSVIDPYYVSDLRFNYTVNPKFMKSMDFTLMINNVFDQLYESNGYAYSYISGGEKVTENYFYPQAGINVMGMVTLKF